MKTLSGRISHQVACPPNVTIEGEIFLNNHNIHTLLDHVGCFVDYVDQTDSEHAPLLTEKETLCYAWQCTRSTGHPDDKDKCEADVAAMLAALGLQGCQDTLVGDEATRGISGGEKRRLSLGEMLILHDQLNC